MRVGIITFHASYNFGSALQAYALLTCIRQLGHDATIVDYHSRDQNQYKLISPLHPRHTFRVLNNYALLRKRRSSFREFTAEHLSLTKEHYSYKKEDKLASLQRDFDCFVCGSDQIWNLNCTQGVVEPFFLSFAGNRRRVAYAPSLAHTKFEPDYFDKQKVSELLSDFDYISVRESETLSLFQPLVDKSIDVVLDPTLLLSSEDYRNLISASPIEGDYIFVYLLRSCDELIDSAVTMAAKAGMKVAYVSERTLPIPNGINLFGIGPSEFLSAIANANVVLANSFHAAVFSVLFHKPFRIFATDESGARMRCLLGDLGIGERCVSAADSSPISNVDWDEVERKLKELRLHSLEFLRKALR